MDNVTFATPQQKSEHAFFLGTTITMAIVVLIGFSRSFALRPWFPEFEALALAATFIIALVAWDLKSSRRIHPVTLWAGILTISSQPIRFMIMGTEPWIAFAGWMMGLVG